MGLFDGHKAHLVQVDEVLEIETQREGQDFDK